MEHVLPEKNAEVSVEELFLILKKYNRESTITRIKENPPEKPFKSDGASCFPDKINGVDLYPAAFLHDIEYWVGGTEEDRLNADCDLTKDVVVLCGGSPDLARTMFMGVSFGGVAWLPTTWKWGYGQEDHHFFRKEIILNQTKKLDL